jgi:dolichol-phosphate mannosyltransferase
MPEPCDLSVIIPALHEAGNLRELLPQIRDILAPLSIQYEIIVIDEQADEQTRPVVLENHARLLSPTSHGYALAVVAGFQASRGAYLITMDADLSHPPDFLRELWLARDQAEVVIASRYVPGGQAHTELARLILSRVLNLVFSRGLAMQVRDMSSGFRLYHAVIVKDRTFVNQNFDILQEVLVHSLMRGYRVSEIPFHYRPRRHGASHARVIQFGLDYLRTFGRLFRLRNSAASADYDSRAYDSWIIPQRYWQRQRFRHITQLTAGQKDCLDVGCGSSRIFDCLPAKRVGVDLLYPKLLFARRVGSPLVQGSGHNLPIAPGAFECVVCSQVIEHMPRGPVLDELDRVLGPGGLLVLGTPDYAHWQWRAIEALYKVLLPNAYGDEHITCYTFDELISEYVHCRGYRLEAARYILRGEMILALRKPLPAASAN